MNLRVGIGKIFYESFANILRTTYKNSKISAPDFATSGLYYKHTTIVNDDTSVVSEQNF